VLQTWLDKSSQYEIWSTSLWLCRGVQFQ